MPCRTKDGRPPRYEVRVGEALILSQSPAETRRRLSACAERVERWPGVVTIEDTQTGRVSRLCDLATLKASGALD